MRTQVFAHKGIIGIQSDINAEGLLNDPKLPNQLGFVIDAKFVDIQPEALELLKQIKQSADDIGDIDVYESEIGVVFSWLGGPLKVAKPDKITGSNCYDANLLTSNSDVKPSQSFIEYVDNLK